MNNPMEVMMKQFLMNMMNSSKVMSNPITRNAIGLANNGDEKGLLEIAQNLCKSKGKNFDEEFAKFKNQFGL